MTDTELLDALKIAKEEKRAAWLRYQAARHWVELCMKAESLAEDKIGDLMRQISIRTDPPSVDPRTLEPAINE